MHGLRTIGRALLIVALTVVGIIIISQGLRADAGSLQLPIGVALLAGAFGLLIAWFFPTS